MFLEQLVLIILVGGPYFHAEALVLLGGGSSDQKKGLEIMNRSNKTSIINLVNKLINLYSGLITRK